VRLRGYRWEFVVLALVALATLPVVDLAGPQDFTRFELTRHLALDRSLSVERGLFDRAVYGGRSYSDKAPGMSFLAVPVFQVERMVGVARAPYDWVSDGDLSLWGVRLATSGLLFLVAVFLVGRVGEGMVRGGGAFTAAVYGVGTLAAPLAPTFFEHDAAACLSFGGFLLAWCARRRPRFLAAAGLAVATAVTFSYATAVIALAVFAYAVVANGRRAGWLLLGALPPLVLLGAYDRAAFGSPFHLSYRYVSSRYADQQHGGFFGIGVPTLAGLRDELVVDRGLLVFSPVLVMAAVGLWMMARRGYRREAIVAGFVVLAFLWIDAGYFLPYGGISPGPRFFAPALPFLALGLPFAFARFPAATVVLAVLSAGLTTADAVTWSARQPNDRWYPGRGLSDLVQTIWVWFGSSWRVGAGVALLCALGAVAIASIDVMRAAGRQSDVPQPP
jgi:hypothetical protein